MLAQLHRLGTIAAVARELHLTAPGVSMQLAALEREVGLTLTERHGRTLTLTPAGLLLAKHGHDIVDLLSVAELEVAALLEGSAGTYRVAAFPSIARTVLADAWQTLLSQPELGLKLELLEAEPEVSLPALVAGEVDLALTHSYSTMAAPSATDCVVTRILTEPVWLAVPRGTAAGTQNLEDFSGHDWVVPHAAWSCHEMVQRACGVAGFAPRSVAEATDFSVIVALVGAGAGVALVPELTVGQLPDSVTLHPLENPVYRHDFVVVRHSLKADPGIRRLHDLFAAAAGSVAIRGLPANSVASE
ncbi:LysR family transcriptional regulator [Cryobacterium sp. PH31-L1]|uniref:LysR family transcriptional regulator n=1 Tax=Cryobacterium sp. PH31-L1 TaxID=3046199 RepID=UPI0024B9E6A0|nr:LysR family transcriptional regulator [Cryobacterium sp. PH31-L1]MDJ0377446.1 LysR family transcriptional regulator [Cryobacterium sp. PH31-L1]